MEIQIERGRQRWRRSEQALIFAKGAKGMLFYPMEMSFIFVIGWE
jgi:hypothetical protein